MSRSINRVTLLGHLGKDAEVKYTPKGIQVANFTLATSRRWKPEGATEWREETDWHRCIYWRCENLVQYLTKGRQLFIEGRLQTRSYDDKDGVKRYVTEIVCDELILLAAPGNRGDKAPGPPAARKPNAEPTGDWGGVSDADVPF